MLLLFGLLRHRHDVSVKSRDEQALRILFPIRCNFSSEFYFSYHKIVATLFLFLSFTTLQAVGQVPKRLAKFGASFSEIALLLEDAVDLFANTSSNIGHHPAAELEPLVGSSHVPPGACMT
jgi:hypothetical protein